MPQVINTNILSLTAQRNLNNTQSALATAMQRLSSGLRINSAKDDAAGLAIATRFTTQINGLNTAVRNANDGISLAQTTGSALAQVTANLQSIRTLAVQSANATNSASDRNALQAEVQQRLDEITRIARQTTFNGRHVLDGTFGSAAFQVGANVGETITINLNQGTAAADIGSVATVSQDVSSAFAGGAATGASVAATGLTGYDFSTNNASFDVDGNTVSLTTNLTDQTGLVTEIQNQLDSAASGTYTVAADGSNGFTITTTATGASEAIAITNTTASNGLSFGSPVAGTDAGAAVSVDLAAGQFTITGTDGAVKSVVGTDLADASDLAAAINAAGAAGVSAYVDDSGNLAIQSNGKGFSLGGTALATGGALAGTFASGAVATDTSTLSGVSVATVAGADNVINRVDAALTTISGVRSDLGAIQNRFDSTISNLQAISENLSASRSRIQDADFAKETAQLSRAQILQQAGVAMLAQANVAPQTVLKLLQ